MNINSRPKKRIPYWCALVVGTLIPIIGVSLFILLRAYGTFTSWTPIGGPPSGIAKIITFEWEWSGEIWVKANDGNYYSSKLLCLGNSGDASSMCLLKSETLKWIPENDLSRMTEEKTIKGNNCASLKKGVFPFNPAGSIRECYYTYLKGWNGGDFYVALMADGSLKCWENHEYILPWILLFLASIALSLIVAVIITGIYLIKYLVRRN